LLFFSGCCSKIEVSEQLYYLTFGGFMKKFFVLFFCVASSFMIGGCAFFKGMAVIGINDEINNSQLSKENAEFERNTGVNLTVVKRGVWSMSSTYHNANIESYYNALISNDITFSVNENQKEFSRQTKNENKINITINGEYKKYTEIEKSVMIIVSTSTLALLKNQNTDKIKVQTMFFNFIDQYKNGYDINGIINSQWFKDKKVSITDDGIIIG
jgi:hypothetical protein